MKHYKLIELTLEFFSWSFLIALGIGLGYFVQDIWDDFQTKKTSERVFAEHQSFFKHPAITFCFNPHVNEAKLKKKYNLTLFQYSLHYRTDILGFEGFDFQESALEIQNNVAFKIGRDFNIKIVDDYGTQKEVRYRIQSSMSLFTNCNFLYLPS